MESLPLGAFLLLKASLFCYIKIVEWPDHRLSKVEALVEENNQILRRLQRASRWARLFVWLKWLLVIGGAFGLYYYLEPMLGRWLEGYEAIRQTLGEAGVNLPAFTGETGTSTPPR